MSKLAMSERVTLIMAQAILERAFGPDNGVAIYFNGRDHTVARWGIESNDADYACDATLVDAMNKYLTTKVED